MPTLRIKIKPRKQYLTLGCILMLPAIPRKLRLPPLTKPWHKLFLKFSFLTTAFCTQKSYLKLFRIFLFFIYYFPQNTIYHHQITIIKLTEPDGSRVYHFVFAVFVWSVFCICSVPFWITGLISWGCSTLCGILTIRLVICPSILCMENYWLQRSTKFNFLTCGIILCQVSTIHLLVANWWNRPTWFWLLRSFSTI